ncbi:MAG: helix-turn-helix domain-containing protein [Fretibacterium sp.]|nr:helix-turn-helix domain-containing protein [Fretibacterium sp.]
MFVAKPIIQRLKSYRESRGIRQGDLAKLLGVSAPTLSRWMNGRITFNPTLKQLISMADIFGVTLIDLVPQCIGSSSVPPAKAKKSTDKTAKSRPASKTSIKAAPAESPRAPSRAASGGRPSRQAVSASAAPAVSKDIKLRKDGSAEKPVKQARRSLARRKPRTSATAAAAPAAAAAASRKRGRPRKQQSNT